MSNVFATDVPPSLKSFRVTNYATNEDRIVTRGHENGWVLCGLLFPIVTLYPTLKNRDAIGTVTLLLLGIITFGISNIVYAFTYNNWYAKRLKAEGYVVNLEAGYVVNQVNNSQPSSMGAELRELALLHRTGDITAVEYAAAKQRIINAV